MALLHYRCKKADLAHLRALHAFMREKVDAEYSYRETAEFVLRFNDGVLALRERIVAQRPGIVNGGGLAGYFTRAIQQQRTSTNYVVAGVLEPDELQLLWDALDAGDVGFAAALYLMQLQMGGHEDAVWELVFHLNEDCHLRFVDMTPEKLQSIPEMDMLLYNNIRKATKFIQLYDKFTVIEKMAMTLYGGHLPELVKFMRLSLIQSTAVVSRRGEAVWFQYFDVPTNLHFRVDARGRLFAPGSPDCGADVLDRVQRLYTRYCVEQMATAVELVRVLPENGNLWHYLWAVCPTVTDVEVLVYDGDREWTELRNVAAMAARYSDVAFAASGRARDHWTRDAHQYGERMLACEWPDIPPGMAADTHFEEIPASDNFAQRRPHWQSQRALYGRHALVMRVPPDLQKVIAVYLLGKQRLWRQGLLNPGPEAHNLMEDEVFENLTLEDVKMFTRWGQ